MQKIIMKAALLGVFVVAACAMTPPQPLNVGDKLIVPTGHAFILPPEGIRFSNGATIGGAP